MFWGGGSTPAPPPPPPPPPNPPTYASSQIFAPSSGVGTGTPGGLFQSAILTSPLGAPSQNATQRKQLFGA